MKQPLVPKTLLKDLREIIVAARADVARTVNSGMAMLYWKVGYRIRQDILKGKRAEYGEEIVSTVSAQLAQEYGSSFSLKNLRRMIQFAETYPNEKIVVSLIRQLTWTHLIALIPLREAHKREFYAEMCRTERWSVRTLRQKIGTMLYERTAISKKPADVIEHDLKALREEDRLTPDLVFRDPYFLDFLGLTGEHSEKDIESAILREMERFIVELGIGFAFVARQKRITVDNQDYYLDLLFYHRDLRRLVAIELKLGDFRAADKGQMELYLRWLEKYDQKRGEESPIGLILCAGKTREHVEILQLDKSGIRVAEYLTELPEQKLLKKKFHDAVVLAKERLEQGLLPPPDKE